MKKLCLKDQIISCGGLELSNSVTKECYFIDQSNLNWQLKEFELTEKRMFAAITNTPLGNFS